MFTLPPSVPTSRRSIRHINKTTASLSTRHRQTERATHIISKEKNIDLETAKITQKIHNCALFQNYINTILNFKDMQ